MKNNLNATSEWRIEEAAIIVVLAFFLISIILSYLLWHVKIPFTNDIIWSNWPPLAKAIWGYIWSLLGIQTDSWISLNVLLNAYDLKKFFILHFYTPILLALPFSCYLGYLAAKPRDQYHARGRILLSSSSALKYAKKKTKSINKTCKESDSVSGVQIHPHFRLPTAADTKGFVFLGGPGSGKTQIMKQMLIDVYENQKNAKICLLDNKGDFTELFDENESTILAPWDSRAIAWDVGQDIRTELEAELLSHAMITALEGDNSVFSDASRVAFTGLIIVLQRMHGTKWGWKDLEKCLEWPREKVIQKFENYYPLGLKIFREDSKSSDSVDFSLVANLAFLRQLAQAWPTSSNGFSLRSWISDDSDGKQVLLLQASKAFPAISDRYICSILSVISQLILSPTFEDSSTRRIHFVLDEIAQIPYIQQLKNLAALGRSKGACIWLGVQDFDLLVQNYGQHEVNSLVGMMQTQVILAMGSGPGSDFASKLIGDREIYTESFDESGNRIPRTESQRLVTAAEINQLPQPTLKNGIHGWITVTGWDAVLHLTWPIKEFIKLREGVELAPWVYITSQTTHTESNIPNSNRKRLIKKSTHGGSSL
ncbi:type IV secretion system DNA-binding domain-containing protein [Acinetobacter baumannii]